MGIFGPPKNSIKSRRRKYLEQYLKGNNLQHSESSETILLNARTSHDACEGDSGGWEVSLLAILHIPCLQGSSLRRSEVRITHLG